MTTASHYSFVGSDVSHFILCFLSVVQPAILALTKTPLSFPSAPMFILLETNHLSNGKEYQVGNL